MSLFFKRERRDMDVLADLITNSGYSRTSSSIVTPVTRDSSLQSSVKWACQRLRADLVSTTPLDVMRDSATGVSTILPTPPVPQHTSTCRVATRSSSALTTASVR